MTRARSLNQTLLRRGTIAALAIALAGCAEVMTYSKDAQREGLKMYLQGDYVNAAGAFRESVRQQPGNYLGWYYLGMSDLQINNYQDAIVAFRTSRGLIGKTLEGKHDQETHDRILTGLATAIAKCDQKDIETDAVAKEASDYSSGDAYFLLGQVYAFRGDPDSALNAFNQASLIDPNNFSLFKTYGLYAAKLGVKSRAETALRRAYSLNPNDADVNNALRQIGVIPGPSLMGEDQLARPLLPKGPLPNVWENATPAKPSGGGSTAAPTPRD